VPSKGHDHEPAPPDPHQASTRESLLPYAESMIRVRILGGAAALWSLLAAGAAAGPVELTYLYDLADFTGTIPYSDARVVADVPRHEVYTIYGNEIRVFNNAGMEIYRFDMDPALGRMVDLGIESNGDMLMLVYSPAGTDGPRWTLLRADYRGRPTEEVMLERTGDAAGLLPNRLLLRAGRIWLVTQGQ